MFSTQKLKKYSVNQSPNVCNKKNISQKKKATYFPIKENRETTQN